MSRDDQTSITAPLKVLGIPETFCYENVTQFVQALATNLVAVIPTSITNVVVGNIEPNDTQRFSVWFRLNNAGTFVGIYVFSDGKWVPLFPPVTQFYDPLFSTSDTSDMQFTGVDVLTADYIEMGDFVWISAKATGDTQGIPVNGIRMTLPVDAFDIDQPLSGTAKDGGQTIPATAELISPSVVEVRKYDNSNWGIGTERVIGFSGFYRKAL